MEPVNTVDWAKRANGVGGSAGSPASARRDGSARDGEPVTADGMMPLWAVSLGWELRRGRQVVLNGQIRDRWWFADRPASFREVVAGLLEARGAEVVGWWDPVGGLGFPLPGHAERFDQLREGRAPDRPGTRAGTGDAPPDDPGTARPPHTFEDARATEAPRGAEDAHGAARSPRC
ncbi:hypothetical protein [Streptomyces sp. NPDC047981]|uniref:hypothetical protein n=1 Tax=Streptomyces sp. NPDC047981 TaxID=3154610 RepID=UPI0034383B5D